MKGKKGWVAAVLIIVIILIIFILGVYLGYLFFRSSEKTSGEGTAKQIISNPINSIKSKFALQNSSVNSSGGNSGNNEVLQAYNESKIIEEGVREFNEEYINYILQGLGVNELHSAIGFGNPVIEVVVDEEVWSSEIMDRIPNTIKESNDNKDIMVILSKEEAVKAILSNDIGIFMKNSVANGNTEIKMVAGNAELFAKGYLSIYNSISGKVTFKVNF